MSSKVSPQRDPERGGERPEDQNSKNDCCISSTNAAGITCSFVIFTALNVAMIIVGATTLGDCPEETMVPKYLIVAGVLSLSLLLVRILVSHVIIPYIKDTETAQFRVELCAACSLACLSIYDSLASIFSTLWLIIGSIYVYGAHPQYDNPDQDDYCDEGAYLFAFIVITIGYISLGLSILACCLHMCFKNARREQQGIVIRRGN